MISLQGYISDSKNKEYKLSIEYDKTKTELLSGYNDQGDLITIQFKDYFEQNLRNGESATEGVGYITI